MASPSQPGHPRLPSSAESPLELSPSVHDNFQDIAEATASSTANKAQSTELIQPADAKLEVGNLTMQNADASTGSTDQIEPRHCWICLQDEGEEEDQDKHEWRSPCPCNLQAHEECMLEWIADREAEDARGGRATSKILCPQCKSEIKVQRPRDIIVSLYWIVRSTARLLMIPTGLSAVIGILYSGSMVYGVNTFYLICGEDVAHDILYGNNGHWKLFKDGWALSKLIERISHHLSGLQSPLLKLLNITDPFMPYYTTAAAAKLFFGMPLIAPALILSRTSLAEHTFAIVPITYFLARPGEINIQKWPPSPGLALAVLPYFRAAYFELYKYTFGDLEKKWSQAVQRKPREGETAEQVAQAQQQHLREMNDDVEIEIQLNVGNDMEPAPPFIPAEIAAEIGEQPVNAPLGGQPAPGVPEVDPPAEQPPAQQPNNQPGQGLGLDREFRQVISTAQIATTVMGALFFPAVSSLMGDLLKATLPRSWVVKPALSSYSRLSTGSRATGLLQEKWGRSLVGGCLFVVLKDALNLYVKWRKAKDQGKRKVLNYVGEEKRGRDKVNGTQSPR